MGGNSFNALIVGCYDGDKLKFIAKVRAGFVPHTRCALCPLLLQLNTDKFRSVTYRKTGECSTAHP